MKCPNCGSFHFRLYLNLKNFNSEDILNYYLNVDDTIQCENCLRSFEINELITDTDTLKKDD